MIKFSKKEHFFKVELETISNEDQEEARWTMTTRL